MSKKEARTREEIAAELDEFMKHPSDDGDGSPPPKKNIIQKAREVITGKKEKKQYKKVECPYCHRHFGNLQNHINAVHPTEPLAGKQEAPELTARQALGHEDVPAPDPKPWEQVYACQNCRAELRKGEQHCWNCGNTLDWTGIV